ncbi:hypothetical protein SAMN03159341_102176 [Paenibacillus sp. 1_12]|uniref:hypothetical protein n=1 Tax=Paenibacillus sp. 1_12 TaxID=1566278 RepID=UPI0008E46962|nr:hypothetical protein [Paenibacillus sp. 1_12]SFK92402.1 hypothetical protein SAMN03159341_102176 [Paenibacillus sp. 1_12]
MKVGAFLLGGLVGAAAVVYLSGKSKSMLMSSFSSNRESVGNNINKNGNNNQSASHNANKPGSSDRTGLGRVEEIINKEPALKATVDEILRDSQHKEQYQTQ